VVSYKKPAAILRVEKELRLTLVGGELAVRCV